MANNSLRSRIIEVLCDPKVFPVGDKGPSWEIAEQVRSYLLRELEDWDSFYHSVREALEVRDGEEAPRGPREIEVEKRTIYQDGGNEEEINWYTFR